MNGEKKQSRKMDILDENAAQIVGVRRI